MENCVDGRGDCVVFPPRFSPGYVKPLRSGVCSTDGKKYESLLDEGASGSCCGWDIPNVEQLNSWPDSVTLRWERINVPKTVNELGCLSWNTNGRLELRGCRESLIRSWAR